ncbi:MAG TPA: TetR/AcrR family transcriptional regulator [Acidimicrobiales bacterium]|nr:TetR/AcrR family transcriptional regulator [Acidimicrobiales bacterium]
MELIAERGYEQISVVDVCERAMVHRTTFYKHYTGKGELLDDVVDDHLARLVHWQQLGSDNPAQPAGPEEAERVLTAIFDQAARDRAFYALLGDDAFAAALTPRLTAALRDHLAGGAPVASRRPDKRAALRAHLHAAIVVTTIAWTVSTTDPLRPHELARLLVDEFFERPQVAPSQA